MNRRVDSTQGGQAEPVVDRHRPRYHFLPPAGWMNDPNGLISWRGAYHMFYQYNPLGAFHNAIQWGHAISTDLAHWEHLPIALAPTAGSVDADGCFTGCVVDHDGVPTIIYSGHRGAQQRPCVATSADNLLTWQKYSGNPVIAASPAGLDVVAFRDHCVWQSGDTWYQLIGSGIKERGGAVLLYCSRDLLRWEYMHPLCVGEVKQATPLWTGSMWECPDFFALGERHVLVISVWHKEQLFYPIYFSGSYANYRFTPGQPQRLDFGASFYAPQTLHDAQGRRIMFGWLREERDEGEQIAAGWSGVMSLPRVLSIGAGGILDMRSASEIELLRGRHYTMQGVHLAAGSPHVLDAVGSDSLEISAEFAPGDATEVGIALRCSADGREQTLVLYDCVNQHLVIDASQSSLSDTVQLSRHAGPFALSQGETLRLRIFLDRSIVEVFANERSCATARIYPTRDESVAIALFAQGGSARLLSIDVWEMQSIWADGR